MSDKRRLGRGLGALIPDAAEADSDLREIPVNRIRPNPYQPRISFDEAKLRDLAESIKAHGVVQAVVVSPSGNEYILVAGERRFRAAQMAGLTTIPGVVREFNRSAMLEIALIENLQREDLNPVEEATAYRKLMDEFKFTQEELARRIGRSRSAIANTVRLLSLPALVKEALIKGELSAGQARPLLAISDAARQETAARQIVERGMTARAVEKMVSGLARESTASQEKQHKPDHDPLRDEIRVQLQRYLGTKVKINYTPKGGSIEINYYGEEDLERLVSLLLPGDIA